MIKTLTRFVIPIICLVLIVLRSLVGFRFDPLFSWVKNNPTTVMLIVIGVLSAILGYAIPKLLRFSKPFRDKANIRTVYIVILSIVSLTLVILHGLTGDRFKVDAMTVILLAVAALPLVQEYLSSIKAGNIEVTFRELSVHDQIFVFLDGIARQQAWTFYKAREGETELGPAFVSLVEELIKKEERKLKTLLKEWLHSNNDNLIYFASEVIGYFNSKFSDLKNDLPALYKVLDINSPWYRGHLNSLWAYSRYNQYKELNEFLLETKDEENQRWVLVAYEQMLDAKHAESNDFMLTIDKFLEGNADNTVKEKAKKMRGRADSV